MTVRDRRRHVSILVLMEVLREAAWWGKLDLSLRVSILVLMEVLREARRLASRKPKGFCFNPCFNGSVERGPHIRGERSQNIDVSILVLMEVLREVRVNAPLVHPLLFQSLF